MADIVDMVTRQIEKPAVVEAAPMEGKSKNKDLQKTKLCIYHAQGMCTLGEDCQFAHSVSEMRKAPNLAKTQLCKAFMNGYCSNANCSYAHGEAELVNPPNFKKKLCHWHAKGKCRNGDKCGFAHAIGELADPEGDKDAIRQWLLTSKNYRQTVDWDASTVASSSRHETEVSATSSASRGSMPDESLYRMMAGRGSAPLQDQVASMGMAIAELQAKLSQVEGKVSGNQVGQMQKTISQLSNQYGSMEAQCQNMVQSKPMNPAAEPFTPSKPIGSNKSDTAPTKRSAAPQAKKPRPKNASIDRKSEKANYWQTIGTRSLLAVFTISVMVAIELYVHE